MRRKPDIVFQDVTAIHRNLAKFDLPTLSALARIDRFNPNDTGSSSEGPKPKHSVSDPVGNRVVAKLSGRTTPDPVGKTVKEIDRELMDIRRRSEILVQQLDFVLNPRDRHKDNYVAHCEACRREVACTTNDRLRSGYCMKDYREWVSLGRPDRLQFELMVRERSQADESATV